jgi:hypothetical protein
MEGRGEAPKQFEQITTAQWSCLILHFQTKTVSQYFISVEISPTEYGPSISVFFRAYLDI